MKSNFVFRATMVVLAATGLLHAQAVRPNEPVPLKNWATPQYWQPSQAEREASGKTAAQIQFSSNQVSNTALTFVAITPCRLVDTRGGAAGFNGGVTPFAGPSIPSGGTITIPVQSAAEATANTAPAPCGTIPSIAQAYSLNLTVVPKVLGTAVNYITMWPAGGTQPFVATVNDPQGQIVFNAAIVPAGTPSGGISVFNVGPSATDVIIDMNGFYAVPGDLSSNTAVGLGTLAGNTTGADNTAIGVKALVSNTTGGDNTANGFNALYFNTTGTGNTATGYGAMGLNISGNYNTANGWKALFSNSTGINNTADGAEALSSNTNGGQNTAIGFYALSDNTSGFDNTAIGLSALGTNTTGSYNTAVGASALPNSSGSYNTAVGASALVNSSGSLNIAVGDGAGSNPTTGSNNIYIFDTGSASDNGVIKIGSQGTQTATFIAGIFGATGATGSPVYVNNVGQLITSGSSHRFKEQITDMGDTSDKLFQLRPVNFYYKPEYDDGSHLLQYGLIAEEVEKIYPEMVSYDKDGKIYTVKYQMLAPMLLNEVQKQNAQLQQQQAANRQFEERDQRQSEQIRSLEGRLAGLESLLSAQPQAPQKAGTQ